MHHTAPDINSVAPHAEGLTHWRRDTRHGRRGGSGEGDAWKQECHLPGRHEENEALLFADRY